ncbi:hypothetical protein HanXRQr2_Chr08g0358701 [Helianthus annuus]|uniref:Uncharacterized protein n=2 Tax=Helianthus annuus TaxID=4232 RepID=A0A9K3IHC8_HELAN|nr:hypothetical protein HanXRQr2_Chr08g0358701 [Helianthus annuus]KAJ0548750.1 hypothetical protein HanIR_Chr08g0387281 [Helianthus annuus]KAJ0903196.1 hypothetical protein HanPSC8_Chr08g0346221 [Helianthus annuus]
MARLIVASIAATAFGFIMDHIVSTNKLFGGTTPRTMSKEWQDETEKMKNAWPRTAGPPVVLNPLTRQNFIVNSRDS